ncbi:UbiA family prenyltransferase [Nocardia bovistercoris]|uniref:UbiA family prenyltransferase n=1 Tax=Nocardia bovistercoris TaxID=2785916 RepID=A0A931IBT4_9NOCA|nr:UbiA family prenyltransferase [Nocardia bovistercoris]MBH0776965.1 UbiA family prenyltransferase [Nocardia bovistercoris]
MAIDLIPPARTDRVRPLAATVRELRICWAFTRGDLSATVLPATVFTMAAAMSAGLTLDALPGLLLRCVPYFWLYIYTFDLSNQLTGIDEDRINKPHRPLVTGLVTPAEVRVRLIVTTVAFLALGAALGVFEWTVLWVAAWVFHNHLGGAKFWWGKNLAMVAGTIAQLAAAWQIVTGPTATAWTWILAIAVPLAGLVSLQDLRDRDGDLAVGRRTMVVVLGEAQARLVLAVAFAVYPVLLYVLLYDGAPTAAVLIGGVGACVLSLIAFRVLALRSRRADHHTYLLYTAWYCLALASAIPVFAR